MFWPYRNLILIALLVSVFSSCVSTNSAECSREINTGWKFKKQSESSWYKATVPGTVHTDLLANKIIEEPFYRLNELDLQWIDKCNWEYETSFHISRKELSYNNIQLNFYGS